MGYRSSTQLQTATCCMNQLVMVGCNADSEAGAMWCSDCTLSCFNLVVGRGSYVVVASSLYGIFTVGLYLSCGLLVLLNGCYLQQGMKPCTHRKYGVVVHAGKWKGAL
jgi:hypothetical protein